MSDNIIEVQLEIDESDSKIMESIAASGTKISSCDSDDSQVSITKIEEISQSELQSSTIRCVEVDMHSQALHSILSSGAVLAKSDFNQEAFDIALDCRAYNMCTLLVKCIDVNETDGDGRTPLHYAVEAGQVEFCTALIKAGINLNQKDYAGATALMLAARDDQVSIVKMLIEAGCDVNHKDDSGQNAIMYSLYYGASKTSRILLDNGAAITVNVLECAKNGVGEKDEEIIELISNKLKGNGAKRRNI